MPTTISTDGRATGQSQGGLVGADHEELRKQALANLKRKRKFSQDLLSYIAVNGMLWLIWALTGHSVDGLIPWPAWVSSIWGFVLLVEGWKAFGPWPRSMNRPISGADIEGEIRRMRSR